MRCPTCGSRRSLSPAAARAWAQLAATAPVGKAFVWRCRTCGGEQHATRLDGERWRVATVVRK